MIETINNPTIKIAEYARDLHMFLKKRALNAFISFIMSSLYTNMNNKSNKNIIPMLMYRSFVLDDVMLGSNIGTNIYNKNTPIPFIDLFKFFILPPLCKFDTYF